MIAISHTDFIKYGCPNCGCDYAASGNFSGGGATTGTCGECNTTFVVLAEDTRVSPIGFSTGKQDKNGMTIFEYPKLQKHPRNGIPKHKYAAPDIRPEYGEYWKSRGIGYDLSGFVKSKAAGERLLEMVKEVLEKEEPASWLDWRPNEPKWIQFKFQKSEFDLDKLDKMSEENNGILTKEILKECSLVKKETKRKYFTYDRENTKWRLIYCDCHEERNETVEEIAKAIVSHYYIGRFKKEEYERLNKEDIKNDEKLVILRNGSEDSIWQIGSNEKDMEGFTIPHTYKVRKIGEII